MNEMTKIWLEQLYQDEIEEVEGTIANERLWLKGSTSAEDMEMHEGNIEDLKEYLQVLNKLKADVADL